LLELPELPPHNLQLKIKSVIIMLLNINQPRICNGTRLAVKEINEKRHRNHNFEKEVQRRKRFNSMDSFYSQRHAIRHQTVAISSAAVNK
jgi:hypothetical protein